MFDATCQKDLHQAKIELTAHLQSDHFSFQKISQTTALTITVFNVTTVTSESAKLFFGKLKRKRNVLWILTCQLKIQQQPSQSQEAGTLRRR